MQGKKTAQRFCDSKSITMSFGKMYAKFKTTVRYMFTLIYLAGYLSIYNIFPNTHVKIPKYKVKSLNGVGIYKTEFWPYLVSDQVCALKRRFIHII